MPISIRLRPDVERLLDQRARREHKTRTALVHEALDAWLKPSSAGLGSAIRTALADAPDGFGIERNQHAEGDTRDWER